MKTQLTRHRSLALGAASAVTAFLLACRSAGKRYEVRTSRARLFFNSHGRTALINAALSLRHTLRPAYRSPHREKANASQ